MFAICSHDQANGAACRFSPTEFVSTAILEYYRVIG